MNLYLLALLAALATLTGYLLNRLAIPRWLRLVLLAALVAACLMNAFAHLHELPFLGVLALLGVGAFVAWLVVPHRLCAGHHAGHEDAPPHPLSVLALVPLLLHAALDAELLRMTSYWIVPFLIVHKLADGTALRVTVRAARRAPLAAAFAVVGVLATPAGLLVPEEAREAIPHAALAAFVVGYYLCIAVVTARTEATLATA